MANAFLRRCISESKSDWLLKSFLTAALFSILLLLFVTPALAQPDSETEWIHGNYSYSTDSCGVCHSTHNASSRYLTTFTTNSPTNDIYQNCTFCHNPLGSSKYDAVNGMLKGTSLDNDGNVVEPHSVSTAGGGFENMPTEISDYSNRGPEYSLIPVTSRHQVNQPNGFLVNIPGGTLQGSDKMELTCTSCHNPHGKTENPKLLRVRLNTWDDQENVLQAMDIPKIVQDPSSSYNNAISNFCVACHTDYLTGTSQNRHPVAQDGNNETVQASSANGFNPELLALPVSSTGDVTCITCHFAHGTTAQVSTTTFNPPSPIRPSTLLRIDERGVCQNCHNKSPDKTQPSIVNGMSFETSDLKHVVLTFNNYISKTSTENPANYVVSIVGDSGVSIVKAELLPNSAISKQVMLTFNKPILSEKTVTITVNNVKDLNGNIVSADGNQFNFIGK